MRTMKSGGLSSALCLLIQRGHMPRNVAISMITIPTLSLSLSSREETWNSSGGSGKMGVKVGGEARRDYVLGGE